MKLIDYFKELQKKYIKLGIVTKVVIMFLILIVLGAFILMLLPTIPREEGIEKKGLIGTLLGKIEKGRYIGSLLKKPRAEEPTLTIESLMCWVLWETNQTNMTISNTTCFKNSVLGYDCLCVTSLS